MRQGLLLIALLLFAAGCAADVKLRNPATGEITVCKGGYYTRGAIGMLAQTAKDLQMRCLDDYQRQGYERVPE